MINGASPQMPCWYYEKRDLRYTPSYRDGIDPDTEARYRREGARFIIDTGTKMGLRFDTCATGVVYFHRFYMFQSFREFHRYVTGACCLFLAGKVEETPKKCKDIIKSTRSMLTDTQFAVFGDDPKEEVMTLERILLQTIKFDLQVTHAYAKLLKYAKVIKGDKAKVQKLIQMAWTFINDSLCTTLCLQWEPDIIAVALMYLASRLSKFDITDWHGKAPGSKMKWWEFLVEDATMDLLEDICHQVLDLYSAPPAEREDSPPLSSIPRGGPLPQAIPPPVPQPIMQQPVQVPPPVAQKRSRPVTPQDHAPGAEPGDKKKSAKRAPGSKTAKDPPAGKAPAPPMAKDVQSIGIPGQPVQPQNMSYSSTFQQYQQNSTDQYSQHNPFISANMTASSFMTQEGAQSIQTLIGGGTNTQQLPKPQVSYSNAAYQQQPAADVYTQAQYSQQASYPQQPGFQPGYTQQQQAITQAPPPPQQITPAQPVQQQQPQPAQNYNYGQTPYSQQPQYGAPAGATVPAQQQFPVGNQQQQQPQPPPPPHQQQPAQFPPQQQFPVANAQQPFPAPPQQPYPVASQQQQFNYQNQNLSQNGAAQYMNTTTSSFQGQPQATFPAQPQQFPPPPPVVPPQEAALQQQRPPLPQQQQQLPAQPFNQPQFQGNFQQMQYPTSAPASRPPAPTPLMSVEVGKSSGKSASTGLATVRITGRQARR